MCRECKFNRKGTYQCRNFSWPILHPVKPIGQLYQQDGQSSPRHTPNYTLSNRLKSSIRFLAKINKDNVPWPCRQEDRDVFWTIRNVLLEAIQMWLFLHEGGTQIGTRVICFVDNPSTADVQFFWSFLLYFSCHRQGSQFNGCSLTYLHLEAKSVFTANDWSCRT